MAFQPYCPKCGSPSISIRTDRAAGWSNPEMMLHCRCGKVLYGEDNIRTLFESQKAAWEADSEARSAEAVAVQQREQESAFKQKVEQQHKRQREQHRQRLASEREQQRQANLAWAEEMKRRKGGETSTPLPEPPQFSQSADVCAWKDCELSTRPNSKYCSIGCKNKNARWRYKLKHGKRG